MAQAVEKTFGELDMAEALLSFQSYPAACTADAGRLKAAEKLIFQSKKTLPCGFCA